MSTLHSKNSLEIFVGASILFVCAVFLTFAYAYTSKSTRCSAGQCYTLRAVFERADGIEIGTTVTLSGIKVGKVTAAALDPESYSAIISLAVQKEVNLPIDTSAEITSSSLLGDKYIALIPGGDTEYLKDGDTIEFTQSSISFENILGRVAFGLDSKEEYKNSNDSEQDVTEDEKSENSHDHAAHSNNALSSSEDHNTAALSSNHAAPTSQHPAPTKP